MSIPTEAEIDEAITASGLYVRRRYVVRGLEVLHKCRTERKAQAAMRVFAECWVQRYGDVQRSR
ncbi:hypothetical protein AOQ71_31590 [Bradyrhizobium manausense]|uniref:Transposase n=1 Tax=Bradyrhizobium manausense TaxID=989370 RepID=A0A0R3D0D3_9BRAD|nr:hypothetical protein AOQ71_31590 [Bradyrhizobium manausense]